LLHTAAEVLRILAILTYPALPESALKIWKQLGMTEPLESVRLDTLAWGQLPAGQKIGEIAAVFPRIEAKEAIAKMQELEVRVTEEQNAMLGKTANPEMAAGVAPIAERIAIEDFSKVDLRVGQVLSAEPVRGSDKLLHLKVDIGEGQPRTIVAGIAEAYTAQELISRKVVIVANLQPRKLRGIESNGMIVAGSIEGGKPVLAGFLEDVPIGARLK
jgi:methionyl-tRNA synthetase